MLNSDKQASTLIPEEITQETGALYRIVLSFDGLITQSEAISLLEQRYHYESLTADHHSLSLLMGVWGFDELATRLANSSVQINPAWGHDTALDRGILYQTIVALDSVLAEKVLPVSLFELVVAVNRRRKARLDARYVRLALRLRGDVECIGEDGYQLRFPYLSSIADKAYRVLHNAQSPMHLRDIWGGINHLLAKADTKQKVPLRSVQQQLVSDPRFQPIGRGGLWKLMEWKQYRQDTILGLIQEFFHLNQSKATSRQVCEYVSSKRVDISPHSILIYLSLRKDLFVKVSDNEYALAAWGGKRVLVDKGSSDRTSVMLLSEIKDIYANGIESMALSELVRALSSRTGLAQSTLYRRLPELPILEITDSPSCATAKVAKYTGNEKLPERVASSKKANANEQTTLRTLIQSEVVEFLKMLPVPKGRAIRRYCSFDGRIEVQETNVLSVSR